MRDRPAGPAGTAVRQPAGSAGRLHGKAGIKAEDYAPSITEGLRYEGKQVALPYDVGPFVIFYNKDAFKAAGLKEPAIGWTTDDFMSDAKP